MRRLTGAQRRCLVDIGDGMVRQVFDVYEGYAWLRGESRTHWSKSEQGAPAPVRSLIQKGMIALGESARPYSGHRITPYVLTEAGRRARADLEARDGTE